MDFVVLSSKLINGHIIDEECIVYHSNLYIFSHVDLTQDKEIWVRVKTMQDGIITDVFRDQTLRINNE